MANPDHVAILKQGVDAWNEWRVNADLATRPDLRGVDLSGQDLALVNFENADLTGANLQRARFEHANLDHTVFQEANLNAAILAKAYLFGAFLFKASLDSADIRDANLSFTQLNDARLCNARLWGTNFYGAILRGADFRGANFVQTNLSDVDLGSVIGLEEAICGGPSSVGIDTLHKSKGKIPESFLRGCGVPEEFIQYLPSFFNQPIQFYSCFISYSHEDKAFARLLHDRLQGQGIRCWLDEHQLLPGDDIHDRIDQGIRLWDKVLLCASKSSLTSWWVDGEINRAFQKEAQLMKERGKKILALIPLNLDGFLFNDDYQSGKKSEIKSRVAANFVGWEKDHALFDRELEKVLCALRSDEGGREKPPPSKL